MNDPTPMDDVLDATKAKSEAALPEHPLLPEGVYHAYVSWVEEKKSREKGHRMLALSFSEVGTSAWLPWDNIMLEGGGTGFGKKKLATLGVAWEPGAEFDIQTMLSLKDKRCFIAVVHRTYQGKTRANVARLIPEDQPPANVSTVADGAPAAEPGTDSPFTTVVDETPF